MIKEFCDRCKKEVSRPERKEIIKDGSIIIICLSCDKDFSEFISNPKKKTGLLNTEDIR